MAENPVLGDTEMSELRRDAIRRAREMQARARANDEMPPPRPTEAPEPTRPEPLPPLPAASPPPDGPGPATEHGASIPGIGGALDFITKDTERSLILILLLILTEEKADNALLFAMMYLLF